jgi:hypothetical protein
MDIKVHPVEWSISYYYFKLILDSGLYGNKNFRIISGGAIQRIYKNYDLVVLDIIATKVISSLLYTNHYIVLYIPDGVFIMPDALCDLNLRAHIVRNHFELEYTLRKYANGQLEKLSSDTFDFKYLYRESMSSSIQTVRKLIFE